MAARRRSESTKGQGQPQAAHAPARAAHRPSIQVGTSGAASVVVGHLVLGSSLATPLVDFPGNPNGPTRARWALPVNGPLLDRAVATRQGALLVFENGDPRLPIVTGLIWSGQPATPFQELLIAPRATPAATAPEARLDGERVVLEGKREVVLKCGEASITLRSDGKLVLRGGYVETHAKGLNRIKGASVKIN
jgi:hypothetical protein